MEPSIYGSADSRHPPTCDIDASVHSEEGADEGEEKIDNAVDDTNSPSDQHSVRSIHHAMRMAVRIAQTTAKHPLYRSASV